jgi:hypothetical protein
MKLEAVTAEIRPRSDWEAADLGFALARRDFWRVWGAWWMAMLLPLAVAGGLLWNHPGWFVVVAWWMKPFGSRLALFFLSRRLFGEKPGWAEILKEVPRAWVRRFVYRMIWVRFSARRAVGIAVEDLEGLRGKGYAARMRVIMRRADGVVIVIWFFSLLMGMLMALAMFVMVLIFIPQGQAGGWGEAFRAWGASDWGAPPPGMVWTAAGCWMLAVSLVDVFATGAGFGIYVNNRTWLEGWDVELAFRRLANRLAGAAVVALGCLICFAAAPARAAEKGPDEIIREVKSHPDFVVQKEKYRVPKVETHSSFELPEWLAGMRDVAGTVLLYVFIGGMIALLVWLAYRYRHVFSGRGAGSVRKRGVVARVVMGMDMAPESLPADVPAAALELWNTGRGREALALLYRGAIGWWIHCARVEILESDTEGECLRRVGMVGAREAVDYFTGLTQIWMGVAYARREPSEEDVFALCGAWPFRNEGRRA